ncbi:helix-turn-helix domain-containing protein [Streptomyces lunaelactis]|uniref:helix-turn-helix domain-containing protein n=1 Tax=Streptomyces lunaelactis TaxID=1535768 RepID=UPI0035A1981B
MIQNVGTDHWPRPMRTQALARGVHMSAGHLSRQFRLDCGESPYAYLMTRRIERATALLRRGDLSFTAVSFAVGRPTAADDCRSRAENEPHGPSAAPRPHPRRAGPAPLDASGRRRDPLGPQGA